MGEHWLICKCTTRRRSLGLVVWLWGIDGHRTMVLRRFDVIQCHEEWIDDTFIHIDLEDGQLDLISTISMSRGIEYLRSQYHALLDTGPRKFPYMSIHPKPLKLAWNLLSAIRMVMCGHTTWGEWAIASHGRVLNPFKGISFSASIILSIVLRYIYILLVLH